MDRINVQRWASSLRQSQRNYLQDILVTAVVSSPSTNHNTKQIFVPQSSEFSIISNESFTSSFRVPPIVTDVCVGSYNSVRNASTTMRIKDNESAYDDQKYSFILSEKKNSMSQDSHRTTKSQFYTLNMATNDEELLHSPTETHFSDNHTTKHRDIDTISDTGTYIIDDDESEQKLNSSLSYKRYINPEKHPHGTFDIHGLISSTAHTIHRPVVDSNISKEDLSLSSSNSSLLSFDDDENLSEKKSFPQQLSAPPQKQIKPAEAFVISPVFETKPLPTTNTSRRITEAPWKSKLPTKSLPIKDRNLDNSTTKSISPPPSARSNQNSTEKYSFHLQKQPPPLKTSLRPHTATNDQTSSSSSFQRQSTPRQTSLGTSVLSRQPSSLSTIDNDETTPSSSKVYATKSFLLRQQHSNASPSTSKPLSRQPLKSLPSAPSSLTNSNSQTNRAVELRRARAQAKIEELTQRTKKQLQKPKQQVDIMSASWHSPANKKDFTNLRKTVKTKIPSQKQDLSTTRTISSSLYHRSSSASPDPPREIHGQQYQKMSASVYSIEGERCDSLRDNGQRLAIKLIQLSSGILEKLKPNDDVTVRELEQLVDKLQTVNRTLTSIDASLTGSTNDDTFL